MSSLYKQQYAQAREPRLDLPPSMSSPQPQRGLFSIDTTQAAYGHQYESDDESAPPSPASVSSDTSAGSWGKMSQVSRGPPTLRRHPDYYIDSGDVVFLVESQLFKAHRYFFVRESDRFRDVLCTPVRSGAVLMGSSDACPVELCEITAKEFSRFLWVFYNPDYSYDASVSKWSSILRLAHLWKFPKVKELAVREMDKLDIAPVDKAVMAREFEVDPARRWLDTAYAALGAREQPLTKNEGLRLGLDVVLHLAEVRERIRERRRATAAETRDAMSAPPPLPPSPPPPPPRPSASQQIGRNDLFAPRSPQAHDLRGWDSHDAAANAIESRPASPAASEQSYDSRMADSRYILPAPCSELPVQCCNESMSMTRSTSSMMSPRSLATNSQHLSPVARPNTNTYTEDDVADVRYVFAP